MTSRRLLLAGLLGSTLVAVGGWGSGALPPAWPAWGPGRALPVVLAWTGVGVLCAAWWASRRQGVRHQRAATALWALPLLVAPPMFSRDLYAYAGQAALVATGRDPYSVGPGALPGPLSDGVDEVWRQEAAPYGPAWLALAGLVVRATGGELLPALLGLRLLAVLGVALTAWAVTRLARDPSGALWLGVANPLVLLHLVAGGHNDALMVGLMAAGVALAATGRTTAAPAAARRTRATLVTAGRTRATLVAAAVLVTLAALVKVPALAALAYLPLVHPGRAGRWRSAALVLATAVVTSAVAGAATGLGWGWLGTLDAGRARLSLFSPLTGLGTALGALDAVLLAGLLAAAVLCVVLLGLAALGRLDPGTALGLALLGVSVLLPVVQPWYLLWGFCLLGARVGPHAAAALGAASLVLCFTLAPSGRHVIRPPLYGLPVALAAAAAAVVALREADDAHRPNVRHTS